MSASYLVPPPVPPVPSDFVDYPRGRVRRRDTSQSPPTLPQSSVPSQDRRIRKAQLVDVREHLAAAATTVAAMREEVTLDQAIAIRLEEVFDLIEEAQTLTRGADDIDTIQDDPSGSGADTEQIWAVSPSWD